MALPRLLQLSSLIVALAFALPTGFAVAASGASPAPSVDALHGLPVQDQLRSEAYRSAVAELRGIAGFQGAVPDAPNLRVILAGAVPVGAPTAVGGWAIAYTPDQPFQLLRGTVTPPYKTVTGSEALAELAQRRAAASQPSGPWVPSLSQGDGIGPGSGLHPFFGSSEFLCTASYLLKDPASPTYYLATAGHCLIDGEAEGVYDGAVPSERAKLISKIEVCVSSCDTNAFSFLASYMTLEPNKDCNGNALPGYDPAAFAELFGVGIGDDIGLVRLPACAVDFLRPYVPEFGGATGYTEPALGDLMVHYGHGTYCCPVVGGVYSRTILDQGRVAVSLGTTTSTRSGSMDAAYESLGWLSGGDSGSVAGIGVPGAPGENPVVGAGGFGINTAGILTEVGLFEGTLLAHGIKNLAGPHGFSALHLVKSDGTLAELWAGQPTGSGGTTSAPAVTITSPAAGATVGAGALTVSGLVDRKAASSGTGSSSSSSSTSTGPADDGAKVCIPDSDVDAAIGPAPDVVGSYEIIEACGQNLGDHFEATITVYDSTVESTVGPAVSPIMYGVQIAGRDASWDAYHSIFGNAVGPLAGPEWAVYDNGAGGSNTLGTASMTGDTVTVDIPFSETGGAVSGFSVYTGIGQGDNTPALQITDTAPDAGAQALAVSQPAPSFDLVDLVLGFLGLRHHEAAPAPLPTPHVALSVVPAAPASAGPLGLIPGSALVPGVVGDVGPVSITESDGNLVVALTVNGALDATVPGPFGTPMTYAVDFSTTHNTVPLTYHLAYSFATAPAVPPSPADSFLFAVDSAPANGLVSYCPMDADISTSHFDTATFQAIWVIPLAGVDAVNLLPEGACGDPGHGRGLQAPDVLTAVTGSATAQAGPLGLGDFSASTDPTTYTVVTAGGGGGDPAPAERVELLLDGILVGHDDVTTSEATATAAWSVDTVVAAGTHILDAHWVEADGTAIASASRTITVGGDCAPEDNTCTGVGNVAPVVDTAAANIQHVANDAVSTQTLSGTAHDDNGVGATSGKLADAAGSITVSSIKRGSTVICTGTGVGCIGVGTATVAAASDVETGVTYTLDLALPADLVEGTYTATVTATDSGGLTGLKTVDFDVYAPGDFALAITGGALHFAQDLAPGQTAATQNFFTVHNTHKDGTGSLVSAALSFQMDQFKDATTDESFATVDHLVLKLDKSGAGNFATTNTNLVSVDYNGALKALGSMDANAIWAVQLVLTVPLGTGEGSYGSTFGIVET